MFDLKKFRTDNGIKQVEISELFHCTQSNISLIERGIRELTPLQRDVLNQKYGEKIVNLYEVHSAEADTSSNAPNNIIGETEDDVLEQPENYKYQDLLNIIRSQQKQIEKLLSQQDKFINIIERYTYANK